MMSCSCGRLFKDSLVCPDFAVGTDETHNVTSMTAVESSHIAYVGFANGMLRVCFKGGVVGEYSNVPREWYDALLHAPSVGTLINDLKRSPERYPWRRLGQPDEVAHE